MLLRERLFVILERILIRRWCWRQTKGGRHNEIPTVDALWGKSRKEQGGFLATVQSKFSKARPMPRMFKSAEPPNNPTAI